MGFYEKTTNIVDKIVSIISPEKSLIRKQARFQEKIIQRTIEGIENSETSNEIMFDSQNMDSIFEAEGENVRERIRYLELSDGAVSGPIKRLTDYAIGNGLAFQSRVVADDPKYSDEQFLITEDEAARVNYLRERKHKIWAKQADYRLNHDYTKLQSLIAGA